jgi:hypothetical protein
MFWRKKKFTYEAERACVIQTIRDFLEGTGGAARALHGNPNATTAPPTATAPYCFPPTK